MLHETFSEYKTPFTLSNTDETRKRAMGIMPWAVSPENKTPLTSFLHP